MATMADAIRDAFRTVGSRLKRSDIRHYVESHHANEWEPSTLTAHLYACAVNNPKAYIHHEHAQRFIYRHPDDTFELYNEQTHGPNVWRPLMDEGPGQTDGNDDTEQLIEASLSLERDLEANLVRDLGAIEPGLTFVDRQVTNDVGRIDVLARDRSGTTVILELKVGEATDASIGQIARYLGWYARQGKVRGILIAADFPEKVKYAASAIPNLALRRFQVRFQFDSVTL
jgi:RecB family endonuclease NucS